MNNGSDIREFIDDFQLCEFTHIKHQTNLNLNEKNYDFFFLSPDEFFYSIEKCEIATQSNYIILYFCNT